MKHKVNIENKKAYHEYEIDSEEVVGIVLMGSEIKSIRDRNASIKEAHCYIKDGEMFITNMHIAEYKYSRKGGHEPYRVRKLLLKRQEIDSIQKKVERKGYTIVPLRLFIGKSGYAKLKIGVAKGKTNYDKRMSLKDKDIKRDLERNFKD